MLVTYFLLFCFVCLLLLLLLLCDILSGELKAINQFKLKLQAKYTNKTKHYINM